ncbi:hypothetical protein BBJ28_00017532 [Nothophytophthora sp. Chile5]|nr:hypothetical protein BBJ28_00017532 [Nothophytophthora sp. Chile5]
MAPPGPPPKDGKLRYRALAYVRRFGRHRPSVIRVPSNRRSFVDSGGVGSTGGGVTINTRSRKGARGRAATRKARESRGKRRHRFLAPLQHRAGGCNPALRLFCGCVVDTNVYDPSDSASFHWGVGFDDSYYNSSNRQRLSNGTRFRLELCGLHVTSRSKNPLNLSIDVSSVRARAASFDSGFAFTVASPVACPPPLGLAPARTATTKLQLRSRDGKGKGELTYDSGSGHFTNSSAGTKRKAPLSPSQYPSYTPNTPPSPFVNDFRPADTFKSTRARSRVSVGCNGWLMADDDPSLVGWHRRRSSGEVKPNPIMTLLPRVTEAESESDLRRETNMSPKRLKKSPRASGSTSGASSSSIASPSSTASSKPPLAPRSRTSSPHTSRGSVVLLSNDGSMSSSRGFLWRTSSALAMVPLPTSPMPMVVPRPSFPITPPPQLASSQGSYDSSLLSEGYEGYDEYDEYGPPSKRRRSTGSSSTSSGGFGFGNMPRASLAESEDLSARESHTSFGARLSASLRLTRSHSPRAFSRALSPGVRSKKTRRGRNRSRSQSGSRGSHVFRLGSKVQEKPASPPPTPGALASSPSIVFIDCPP